MHRNDIAWPDVFKITNYEVIAMIANRPFVTYVPLGSKIKSLSDLKPQQTKTAIKFLAPTPIATTVGLSLARLMKEGVEFFPIIPDSRANTLALIKEKKIGFWIAPLYPDLIKSGEIVPIAVFSNRSFNDIPTAISQGFDIQDSLNYAVIAPRGTPKDIIKILDQALRKSIDNLADLKKGKDIGVEFEYRDADYYIKATTVSSNDFCNLCSCDKSPDCKRTCDKCK